MKSRPAALLASLAIAQAHAASFRIDDTGTSVAEPVTPMRWRQPAPGRNGDHTVSSTTQVFLRLKLAPWVNQRGRIYLALANGTGEPINASWQTQGRLLAGSVSSGKRTLVYDGPIQEALQQETLLLTLTADGRQLGQPQTLQFYFEIDVVR